MAEIVTEDATIHAEVEGSGEPITVFAHGLTNSCNELAPFTPMVGGTKVRFCFRGHGHSSVPETGYRFADFARDLDAVASACGATCAVGTSLGAGAISHLVAHDPGRFERMVFLLPAGLDVPPRRTERFLRTADLLEGATREQAIEAVLADPERVASYVRAPWLRELDRALWRDLNPDGVARAIHGVIEDYPVPDREMLRAVKAPVLLICREGDDIHPAELGHILADLFPNAEMMMFSDEAEMVTAVPEIVGRVGEFLAGR